MFHLAQEWGKVEKALPAVRMVPGENHRERVLAAEEETLYFAGAKSEAMNQHMDASLLADVASILLIADSGRTSASRCAPRMSGTPRSKFSTARATTPAVEFP